MYAASVPIDSTLFQCVSADEQSAAGGEATTVAGEAGKVTRDVDFTGPDCGARVVISSAGSAAGSDWAARFPGASAGGARGSGLVVLVATGASTAVSGLVVLSAAGGGAASSAGGARFGTASVAGAMGSGLAATGASTGSAVSARTVRRL